MKRLSLSPDLIVFVFGLILFFSGLYAIWPPLAFIGGGMVLMGISLFGGKTL